MFEQYFGLRENPFKLEIDTSCLFLGKDHEEAIAHLRYAIMEGEGFIAIIGKRGVGKTIVCESFIENLGSNVLAAYIDCPQSSSEELLKNINSQFRIPGDFQDLKKLNDAFYVFLMQKKLEGKKVAIFIDDAEKLSKEALEQIRLISNLETSREKLLQIVLIGEPKLSEMLASYNLRQIGQRVSVRCHINPLTYKETISYIYYRLSKASRGSPLLFDQKAFRRIFRYSGGIPREINVACNRALIEAFNRREKRINDEIANEAVKCLSNHTRNDFTKFFKTKFFVYMITGCCLLLMIAGSFYLFKNTHKISSTVQNKSQQPAIIKNPLSKSSSQLDINSPNDADVTSVKKDAFVNTEQTDASQLSAESSKKKYSDLPELSSKMTYSVQAGAFRNLNYAEDLVMQLKAKGYPAEIFEKKDSKGRLWHTVRIGDYVTLGEAKAKADKFSALEKMQTAVRPFGKL
jgi:type II secretory pathway predicted ATPase ExeA/cell division septation protein DedD